MLCENSSPSASATSSLRGQIVASDWPPGSSGGSNPPPDGPPPSSSPPPASIAANEEEFCSQIPKRARAESGGGDGGGDADRAAVEDRDRISEIPDAVLLSILSHLPLRDAGRTAVLSARWRGLFDQSLLDFNACQPFPPQEGRGTEWMIDAVTDILAARPHVRIRSFRFVMYGRGFDGHLPVIDGWFRALPLRGIREVDVDMFYTTPKPGLPGSLLHLASLESLKVYYCRFPDMQRPPQLPVLKTLYLSNVTMSEHSLQAMLSHCTALECVKLKKVVGVKKISLQSKSMARLYSDFGGFEEVVIEDAPNLDELMGNDLPNNSVVVKIVFAPKLLVLGYLGMSVRPLVLYDTVFDGGIVQIRTLMSSVKTLAIQVPFSDKGCSVFVVQLLKCFPSLEVLHVEPDKRSVSPSFITDEEWGIVESIQCIEKSIKKVVFSDFGGEGCQWGFLLFLLGEAKALKLVEFYCWRGKDWNSDDQSQVTGAIKGAFSDVDFRFFKICKPEKDLYLCHCCPRQCQKEKRVACSHRTHSGIRS